MRPENRGFLDTLQVAIGGMTLFAMFIPEPFLPAGEAVAVLAFLILIELMHGGHRS